MGRWVILPPDPFIRRISVFEIGHFVRRTLPCMVTLWKENEDIARGSGGRMTENTEFPPRVWTEMERRKTKFGTMTNKEFKLS